MLTKPALDAMTDQAFAATAKHRPVHDPLTLERASRAATLLAEQFSGHEAVAGRAVMCAAQMLTELVPDYEGTPGGDMVPTLILALAAEQLVREAGAS